MRTLPPTLGDALCRFRQSNGLGADEAARASWRCRLGPATLTLPNFAWRRSAIAAHDLHHVLTGYPCSLRGEFQMASWESGAGRMPHWAATAFCLPLVAAGLFWSPRRMFQAFANGRRSHSWHGTAITDHVLAMPLPALHAAQPPAARRRARAGLDLARFCLLIARALFIVMVPALVLVGLPMALHAAFFG